MNTERRLVSMVLALSAVCASGAPVSAGAWLGQKLLASDGAAGDYFGSSADLGGHYAVVGAPYHDHGAVYVFKRNASGQWLESQKLSAPHGTHGFGRKVAITGDFVAVVATSNGYPPQDLVVVYQRSGSFFSYMTTIEQTNMDAVGFVAIDLDGGRLIVSEKELLPGEFDPGTLMWTTPEKRKGTVHIYHQSSGTWVLEASFSDRWREILFGISVAISGNLAVVGATLYNPPAPGSVYVFERIGHVWLHRDTLESNSGTSDTFGFSVSIGAAGRVVVGAPREHTNGPDAGAAYLFARSGNLWAQTAKLTPSDGQSHDRFGYAVAYAPGQIQVVIGSPGDHTGFGGLYVYEAPTLPTKVGPSSGLGVGSGFGSAVSTSGNAILASAPYDDENGLEAGAAFIFEHDQWRQWDLYLTPWPYIYRYRGCGRTPQDVALTFTLHTDRGVTLTYDTLQPPEHGTLVWDKRAQTVTYMPEKGFAGDDSFRLSAWDAAGNHNELAVDVLVDATTR